VQYCSSLLCELPEPPCVDLIGPNVEPVSATGRGRPGSDLKPVLAEDDHTGSAGRRRPETVARGKCFPAAEPVSRYVKVYPYLFVSTVTMSGTFLRTHHR
jgi:hypothetical protein